MSGEIEQGVAEIVHGLLKGRLAGLPHNRKLLQESGELCSLYNSNLAKLAAV